MKLRTDFPYVTCEEISLRSRPALPMAIVGFGSLDVADVFFGTLALAGEDMSDHACAANMGFLACSSKVLMGRDRSQRREDVLLKYVVQDRLEMGLPDLPQVTDSERTIKYLNWIPKRPQIRPDLELVSAAGPVEKHAANDVANRPDQQNPPSQREVSTLFQQRFEIPLDIRGTRPAPGHVRLRDGPQMFPRERDRLVGRQQLVFFLAQNHTADELGQRRRGTQSCKHLFLAVPAKVGAA